MEKLQHFLDVMRPHWNSLALLCTWIAIGIVYLRRRKQWRRKHFMAQVNFSLNYVREGALAMRTLLEVAASDVWLNDHGVRMVLAAARKTTVEQPFIYLQHHKDREFANRAVLNRLSERFADTYLAAALGLPVRTASFYFGISCEKYEQIRTHKLRVLIVEELTLLDLFGPNQQAQKLHLDGVIYRDRLKTLRSMYDQYLRDKETASPVLGQIEMGVPV